MKLLLQITILMIQFVTISQDWQKIDGSQYTFNHQLSNTPYYNKSFAINPFDNSIWMLQYSSFGYLRTFTPDGQFIEYNYMNEPSFDQIYTNFKDITFIPGKVFAVSSSTGLHMFDGMGWTIESGAVDGTSITSDGDTVWVARINQNYLKWEDGAISFGTNSFRRIKTQSSNIWVSTSESIGLGSYFQNTYRLYSPDTSKLLSWNNFDFKFARNSDTLYSSSELGLSLAFNNTFVDTITPGNSINMPAPGIIEFEFDQNDNIWAIFGTGIFDEPTHIGYYERATKTWTQIYDQNNSPVPFDLPLTIEVDTAGNPWVTNGRDIYILKLNNWPQWLDVAEEELVQFSVHPNPAINVITVKGEKISLIKHASVTDLSGVQIMNMNVFQEQIDIGKLSPGIYFLNLETNDRKYTIRLVKE